MTKVSESTRNWETRNQKVSQWKLIPNQKWGGRGSVEMASDSDWYIEIALYVTKETKKTDPGQDEPVILWRNFSWNIRGLGNREKKKKESRTTSDLLLLQEIRLGSQLSPGYLKESLSVVLIPIPTLCVGLIRKKRMLASTVLTTPYWIKLGIPKNSGSLDPIIL